MPSVSVMLSAASPRTGSRVMHGKRLKTDSFQAGGFRGEFTAASLKQRLPRLVRLPPLGFRGEFAAASLRLNTRCRRALRLAACDPCWPRRPPVDVGQVHRILCAAGVEERTTYDRRGENSQCRLPHPLRDPDSERRVSRVNTRGLRKIQVSLCFFTARVNFDSNSKLEKFSGAVMMS